MTKLEVNYFFIIELYCKVYIYNFNQEEMLCIYIKDTFILVELNRHRQKTKYTLKKKKKTICFTWSYFCQFGPYLFYQKTDLTYMLSLIYPPTFLNIKCSFSQFLIINKRWETQFTNKVSKSRLLLLYRGNAEYNVLPLWLISKYFYLERQAFLTQEQVSHCLCRDQTCKCFWSTAK